MSTAFSSLIFLFFYAGDNNWPVLVCWGSIRPFTSEQNLQCEAQAGTKCGAPADVSGLPRDTIKFTALKSLSGVAADTVGCIVPVSTF